MRSGGEALEVEYNYGYFDIPGLLGPIGTSLGFRLKASSKEAKSLQADLYE